MVSCTSIMEKQEMEVEWKLEMEMRQSLARGTGVEYHTPSVEA